MKVVCAECVYLVCDYNCSQCDSYCYIQEKPLKCNRKPCSAFVYNDDFKIEMIDIFK